MALAHPAAGPPYDLEVLRLFQTLGDDIEAEPAAEADHHIDDRSWRPGGRRLRGAIGRQTGQGRLHRSLVGLEERATDLDHVHRELAQMGQRVGRRAEVVQRRPHTASPQLTKALSDSDRLGGEAPLGELENQPLRWYAVRTQRP